MYVMLAAAASPPPPPLLVARRLFLIPLVLLLLGSAAPPMVGAARQQTEDCMEAQRRCASRLGCSIALSNYMLSCGPVVHGTTDQCTRECRMALITLLSMEDRQGEIFMTCDCRGNQMCLDQKARLEVCSGEVIQAMTSVMDNTTEISCSLAQLICSADTSCYTALSYYHAHCRKLMRGEKCTGRCNNSLQILYNRTKARKLRTCRCEGTEEYDCPGLKYNTETLCFGRRKETSTTVAPTEPTHRHRHSHGTRSPVERTTPHVHLPSSPSSTKPDICDHPRTDSPTRAPPKEDADWSNSGSNYNSGSSGSPVTGPSLLAMLYLLTYSLSHCILLLNRVLDPCHLLFSCH